MLPEETVHAGRSACHRLLATIWEDVPLVIHLARGSGAGYANSVSDPVDSDRRALEPPMRKAEDVAGYAMRNIGSVPPTFLAATPSGLLTFIPSKTADEQAKDNLANTARLICVGYSATAAVLMIEAWMRLAPPGGKFDLETPPSEALDRREVVLLIGETFGVHTQKFLPIIRTDAGGFFGFGEYDGPEGDSFQGRFAQLMPSQVAPADQRALARRLLDAICLTAAVLGETAFNN